MIQFLISLMILVISTVSIAGEEDSYTYSDYDAATIKILEELGGEYSNSRSDDLEVMYHAFQDQSPQLGLFPSGEFSFYITDESSDLAVEFDFETMEVSDTGVVSFDAYEDDCDNPGCSTFEAVVSFKKNSKNIYYATLDIDVNVDSDDLSVIYEELLEQDASDEEISKKLNQECIDYYGPSASLSEYVEDYKNSVYCDYKIKNYYKKN